jgi:hypothetical protein
VRDRFGNFNHLLSGHIQFPNELVAPYLGAQVMQKFFGLTVHAPEINQPQSAPGFIIEEDIFSHAQLVDQGQFLMDGAYPQVLSLVRRVGIDSLTIKPNCTLVFNMNPR